MATRACPLGCADASQGTTLGSLEATIGVALSQLQYDLARCTCGKLLYLSPAPTDGDLHAIYVDNTQYGAEYTDPERVRLILEYMGSCFDRMAARRGRSTSDRVRVLEVGAGLAWMCRVAKARNSSSVTVAQDMSPEASKACPWVDRYHVGVQATPALAADGPYDVISVTHVIEHLVEPVAVMKQCRDLLAPDGLLFITAPHRPEGWREDSPSMQSWAAWSYNHVPAHIQYFSRDSMGRLAQAIGCSVAYWNDGHESGQAFEAWLERARPRGLLERLGLRR